MSKFTKILNYFKLLIGYKDELKFECNKLIALMTNPLAKPWLHLYVAIERYDLKRHYHIIHRSIALILRCGIY